MMKNIIGSLLKRPLLLLLCMLVIISLYDLLSPPINRVMWRQTQTAMLTDNYVKEGFSFSGLYINLDGINKLMTVYEFPLYNFLVGVLFVVFNHSVFWGKLVSLIASIISLVFLFKLANKLFGEKIALIGSLFFVFSPVGLLIRTSFQPDALSLMFILIALYYLSLWQDGRQGRHFAPFAFTLLLACLVKVTTIVPYLPIMVLAFLGSDQKKWRWPKFFELLTMLCLVVIPFVGWYLFRGQITDPSQMMDDSKFFLGDINRFFVMGYYIKIAYTSIAIMWCGIGLIYFLLGVRKSNAAYLSLLIGILLYFILIPTAWYQYYYYYSILPIVAIFMARGCLWLYEYCFNHKLLAVFYCCIIAYAFGFLLATSFVLRHDKVMLSAAYAVQDVSKPSDLILSINMHDRGIANGGRNTSLFYLANRKGWAICGNYNNYDEIYKQVNAKRRQGAKWLVITWYTADLEPCYGVYVPRAYSRDPGSAGVMNGQYLFDALRKHYRTTVLEKNYGIIRLY